MARLKIMSSIFRTIQRLSTGGLKTAAGMVRDISLPRIGSETHMLEVTEGGGTQLLTVEIRVARNR